MKLFFNKMVYRGNGGCQLPVGGLGGWLAQRSICFIRLLARQPNYCCAIGDTYRSAFSFRSRSLGAPPRYKLRKYLSHSCLLSERGGDITPFIPLLYNERQGVKYIIPNLWIFLNLKMTTVSAAIGTLIISICFYG